MYTYQVSITNQKMMTATNNQYGKWGPLSFEAETSEEALAKATSWLAKMKTFIGRRDQREILATSEIFDEADVLSERFEDSLIEGEPQIRYVTLCAEATYTGPTNITTQETAKKEFEARQTIGKTVDQIGDEVIHCIIGFNKQANLTEEQLDEMETLFSDILSSLNSYRLTKPKTLIQAIVPANTNGLVTQAMKDEVLAIFTKYGI